MAISFDLSQARRVAAAASHYYEQATEPLYLDRVLTHHDLIYLREGAWAITEGETEYPLERDDVLLLSGRSLGNGQTIDFTDTLQIKHLTLDSLIVVRGTMERTYLRQ